jgi:hypothetical protein
VKALRLQIYALSGRLVFDRDSPGWRLLFEGLNADRSPLANGAYLMVLTVRRNDGTVSARHVQKIVWMR